MKVKLTEEERIAKIEKEKRRYYKKAGKIKYVTIWMDYKGKKLRILIGIKRDFTFISNGRFCSVAFAFQSPLDEDDLVKAKKEVKENLFMKNGINKQYYLSRKKLTLENLYLLALTYPVLREDISWMKQAHFISIDEAH
jgi:hypothetical protein